MERHNGIEPDPEGAFVYYADAQATIAALQGQVELAEKKAWLAAHDVGFFSMWNGTDHSGPPKLALLCNDTFAWATADAEDVLDGQIDTIVELFKTEGEAGVIKWIAQQRNMKPMESVGKWLFGCDAIKKERDDLHSQLAQVTRERQDMIWERDQLLDTVTTLQGLVRALPSDAGEVVIDRKSDDRLYAYVSIQTESAYRLHTARFSTNECAEAYANLLAYRRTLDALTPAGGGKK